MHIALQDIKPDAESATPLYLQMARKLAAAIRNGMWPVGEALPSERALASALGVSRITCRKAMALLAKDGLVRRAQGAGTFILPWAEDRPGPCCAMGPRISISYPDKCCWIGTGSLARRLDWSK